MNPRWSIIFKQSYVLIDYFLSKRYPHKKLPAPTSTSGKYTRPSLIRITCTLINKKGDISTLNDSSLKLVDKLTYLGSSVSSTEKDIDTWLGKAWTAIDSLLVIRKSHRTDKIKHSFFQAAVVSILLHGH